MVVRCLVYDRWLHMLHELTVLEMTHREEIDGEDSIEITTDEPLSWGDRILWDDNGQWREHVVNTIHQSHEGSETFSFSGISSFQWDLSLKHVRYTDWSSANCQYAVTELLKLHPLWAPGNIFDTPNKHLKYERESAYQALLHTAGAFNAEFYKTIEVDKYGVVSRKLSMTDAIGNMTDLRYDYGSGLDGVIKDIDDEYPAITACYGYGSSSGKNDLWVYVTNDAALNLWGLPDGHGGKHHAEGEFTDNDIEESGALTQATTDYLNAHSAPMITYETVIPFASLDGARLGDVLTVTDRDFTPPLVLQARIGRMERNMVTGKVESATFGTVRSLLPDALARNIDQQATLNKNAASIDQMASTVSKLSQSVTTEKIVLTSGDATGTLTVKSDGLYFNDTKIGG